MLCYGGSEGGEMRQPNIAGSIGADVFIGRPEGKVIGGIEHGRAVIANPKTIGKEAAARSGVRRGQALYVLLSLNRARANPHRQVLVERRLDPGIAKVALAILIHRWHLD